MTSVLAKPTMRTTRPGMRPGMTLLEALAAAAILTGGLLAVMQAVQISIRAEQRSEVHATAVRLAAEKMDEIRKEPQIAAGEDSGDFGESFPDHRWEASIVETDLPGLDEVTIIVTYQFAGREEEYGLTSLQRETAGESAETAQ
ncbi:MAG: hypothetical protein ACE5JM_11855 [Armatimonadota bacterium]